MSRSQAEETLLSRYDVFIVYKFSVYDLNFPSYDVLFFFAQVMGRRGGGRKGSCVGKGEWRKGVGMGRLSGEEEGILEKGKSEEGRSVMWKGEGEV